MLIGIDEVGRGCWAGPLVAGAVVLHQVIDGLTDSKQLTRAQREQLTPHIYQYGSVGLGWVTPQEVDKIGLSKSVALAMQRALDELSLDYDKLIIDGNINYFPDDPKAEALIKADLTIPAVSAASIVAKVARDDYMRTHAENTYPQYGFAKHVGYGTRQHIAALAQYGVTTLHRKSYKPVRALL